MHNMHECVQAADMSVRVFVMLGLFLFRRLLRLVIGVASVPTAAILLFGNFILYVR